MRNVSHWLHEFNLSSYGEYFGFHSILADDIVNTVIPDMIRIIEREEKETGVVIINEHMKSLLGEKFTPP